MIGRVARHSIDDPNKMAAKLTSADAREHLVDVMSRVDQVRDEGLPSSDHCEPERPQSALVNRRVDDVNVADVEPRTKAPHRSEQGMRIAVCPAGDVEVNDLHSEVSK